MGSFQGHALPGSFFIFYGVWWSIMMYYRKYTSSVKRESFTSSVTYSCLFLCARARDWPIESALKVLLTTVGFIIEIVHGYDDKWNFNIVNGQHATMYFFFGLTGVIDLLIYFRVSLPRGLDYASISLALLVEYSLFNVHIQGRPTIDVLVHTQLLYVILSSAVIMILEMSYPHNFMIAVTRAYLFILQGTWFWQIGFVIYNPRSGSKPWDSGKHENIMLVALCFTWHLAAILVYMIAVGLLVKLYVTRRCGPIDECVINPMEAKSPGYAEIPLLEQSESDEELDNPVAHFNDMSESSFTAIRST